MNPIGILGGTFDPVHHGHLRLAIEMRDALGLSSVKLVPAPNPRLRDRPSTPPSIRLRMLEAVVEDDGELEVDDREIHREGPTCSVETLRSFRDEFVDTPLCLLVGADAFCRFDQWREWEELPDLAHIAVAGRPGVTLPDAGPVAELMRERVTTDPERLRTRPAGYVIVCDIPALDISGTRIRALLDAGRSVRYLVPDSVIHLIREERNITHDT
ncbi:MAG TPA: nicotinate-nucleotide adenylyltransferase [Gammaproteobacteria bacterium]